ncbi:MAG: 16S rRNA (guanine(966)-N(2))-methyltransferase RsmD [Bacillota bacterium]
MRIIAGKAKGMILHAPKGYATRPTGSRVKEALFNSIQGLELEARVLDLFAGSGALGLEALSRGAGYVVFVENSPTAIRSLTYNIEKTGWQAQTRVVGMDVLSFLKSCQEKPFDLIFIDPPYSYEKWPEILNLLAGKKLLKDMGRLILEQSVSTGQNQLIEGFELIKAKQYGSTALLFYKLAKGESVDGCI